jgi:hypothetical protein
MPQVTLKNKEVREYLLINKKERKPVLREISLLLDEESSHTTTVKKNR